MPILFAGTNFSSLKSVGHSACSIPNISLEIIEILLEANIDLINFVNNEEVDLLQCAIIQKRLDIVKLLVDHGALANKQDLDGDTSLHIAANEFQLDVIRYLIYETDCDPSVCNEKEKTACFLLFAKLLQKLIQNPPLRVEEVDCFEELAQFTYNLHDLHNPNENEAELNHMIHICYHFNQPHSCLYMSIIKLFDVPSSKKYFFQKILDANIISCHCLIIALVEKDNTDEIHKSFEMWSNFLCELFTLFLSDESFFTEYISEIMSNGFKYAERSQVLNFCGFIAKNRDSTLPQRLFSFLKVLILYEIDFDVFTRCCEQYLLPAVMLNVFTPLVKFVIPSYPLQESFKWLSFNYNFNESENFFDDLKRSLDLDNRYEVVSLKNLCRMSIRNHYFKTYSHYNAIKALYTSNIPIQVRNFLCYNFCNFEFES